MLHHVDVVVIIRHHNATDAGRTSNRRITTMIAIESLAKQISEATGKTGVELERLTFGTAMQMAALVGNDAAYKHFHDRLMEVLR